MIPKSTSVDWSDPKTGARMHRIPYSILSDPSALNVEVIYVPYGDALGQYFHRCKEEQPFITIKRGQSLECRRGTLWHELAHVLDFSYIGRDGWRLRRKRAKYSHELQPMLEMYSDVINCSFEDFGKFDDFNPPKPLDYDLYAGGSDDPVELFARLVELSVRFPRISRDKMADLHDELVEILRDEFRRTKIPAGTIELFCRRLCG